MIIPLKLKFSLVNLIKQVQGSIIDDCYRDHISSVAMPGYYKRLPPPSGRFEQQVSTADMILMSAKIQLELKFSLFSLTNLIQQVHTCNVDG
jgi:hypothetical protein